jgi:hypothetical protein
MRLGCRAQRPLGREASVLRNNVWLRYTPKPRYISRVGGACFANMVCFRYSYARRSRGCFFTRTRRVLFRLDNIKFAYLIVRMASIFSRQLSLRIFTLLFLLLSWLPKEPPSQVKTGPLGQLTRPFQPSVPQDYTSSLQGTTSSHKSYALY